MIAVWGSGDIYSYQSIWFIDVKDRPIEEVKLFFELTPRDGLIAIVESIEWRDPSRISSLERWLEGYSHLFNASKIRPLFKTLPQWIKNYLLEYSLRGGSNRHLI